MPKTCAACGGPIIVRKNDYTEHTETPYDPHTIYWHNTCEPP